MILRSGHPDGWPFFVPTEVSRPLRASRRVVYVILGHTGEQGDHIRVVL